MTLRAPVPADVEAEQIADLIADAALVRIPVSLPRRPAIVLRGVPGQRRLPVDITDQTISLTEGYAEYGA